uniref:Adenylyl-sulfate kinase n=1 Tax=Fundidesulfovibrio putealis TaxID=270496 RepID=A0A7C4EJE5_9BACT
MRTAEARQVVEDPEDADGPVAERAGAALWFTGLPGSGKSTLARAVQTALKARGVEAVLLQMDARRTHYTPRPTYTARERQEAYRLFVLEAAELAGRGAIVLMDGSGPELAMRDQARQAIPRFAEVHLRCGVATAMAREAKRPDGLVMAGLYAKAIKRKTTGQQFPGLGQVIGVDVPFQVDPGAELVLDAESESVERMAGRVLERFSPWWG